MNKVVTLNATSIEDLNYQLRRLNYEGWMVIQVLEHKMTRKGITVTLLLGLKPGATKKGRRLDE